MKRRNRLLLSMLLAALFLFVVAVTSVSARGEELTLDDVWWEEQPDGSNALCFKTTTANLEPDKYGYIVKAFQSADWYVSYYANDWLGTHTFCDAGCMSRYWTPGTTKHIKLYCWMFQPPYTEDGYIVDIPFTVPNLPSVPVSLSVNKDIYALTETIEITYENAPDGSTLLCGPYPGAGGEVWTVSGSGSKSYPLTIYDDVGDWRVDLIGGTDCAETKRFKVSEMVIDVLVNDETGTPLENVYVDVEVDRGSGWAYDKPCTDADIEVINGTCTTTEWKGDTNNVITDADGAAIFGMERMSIGSCYGLRVGKPGYLNDNSNEDWTPFVSVDPVGSGKQGRYTSIFTLRQLTGEDKFMVYTHGFKSGDQAIVVKCLFGTDCYLPWGNYFIKEPEHVPEGVVEFTAADGLVKGNKYGIGAGIDIGFGFDVLKMGPSWCGEFKGTKVIDLGRYGCVGNLCEFFGIDPYSAECQRFVADFADPVFVSNVIVGMTKGEDVFGENYTPTSLDKCLLPVVVAGSGVAIPVGKSIKEALKKSKLFSKVSANSPTISRHILDNNVRFKLALGADDADGMIQYLYHIDEATKCEEGGAAMVTHLNLARNKLDEMVISPKSSTDEQLDTALSMIDETSKRLDASGSKTKIADLAEPSGLRGALKKIRGKIWDEDATVRKHAKAHGATDAEADKLHMLGRATYGVGDIEHEILIMSTAGYARPHGIRQFMKEHYIATGITAGWLFAMGPWLTADNLPMTIQMLQRAGMLEEEWYIQWKAAAKIVEESYYAMVQDPCAPYAQENYIIGMVALKDLIDRADPIPEGESASVREYLAVVYGQDIGDPTAALNYLCEAQFKFWNERYFSMTQHCKAPLYPPYGLELTEFDPVLTDLEVVNVVDGDTIDVFSEELDWMKSESLRVRLLGVNTPDIKKSGNGYEVSRIGAVNDTRVYMDVPESCYDDATNYLKERLEGKTVTLISDPNNQYGKYYRLLAVIHENNSEVNMEVLTLGHGAIFQYSQNDLMDTAVASPWGFVPRKTAYLYSEAFAASRKLGVWQFAGDTGSILCSNEVYTKVDVYLDETLIDETTDYELLLEHVPVGTHNVTFNKKVSGKAYSCTDIVDVIKDDIVDASCTMTQTDKSFFWITSDPTGAKIYIDGDYKNDLTPSNDGWYLDPGLHTFMLELKDHETWEDTYTLVAGEEWYYDENSENKTVPLISGPTPTPTPGPEGKIYCKSLKPNSVSFSGATIYVTGGLYSDQYFGETTRTITVPVGTYTLRYTQNRFPEYAFECVKPNVVVKEGIPPSDGVCTFKEIGQTPTPTPTPTSDSECEQAVHVNDVDTGVGIGGVTVVAWYNGDIWIEDCTTAQDGSCVLELTPRETYDITVHSYPEEYECVGDCEEAKTACEGTVRFVLRETPIGRWPNIRHLSGSKQNWLMASMTKLAYSTVRVAC